jgi:hypothetical protein
MCKNDFWVVKLAPESVNSAAPRCHELYLVAATTLDGKVFWGKVEKR